MLHEVLLSLSGHPSPIWNQIKGTTGSPLNRSMVDYVSPPEHAMLASLGHLSDLHIKLKDHTKQISSSHLSTICQAVASSISTQHLARFRKKVLEVEASILSRDAAYVGGYDIVPLSTIVGEFAPWTRRLEWLWGVTQFILPPSEHNSRKAKCTGATLIDFLEKETYTGYSDLEEMAVALLIAAQTAWMRQISTWVLYGNLPAYGAEDFCVHFDNHWSRPVDTVHNAGVLSKELLPHFVSLRTAESILFIGNSLNHIRSHCRASSKVPSTLGVDPALELLPQHLEYLNSLICPLSSGSFANAISSIRLSISQNVLSHLLPLHEVTETLDVLYDYLLLGRGEFAVSLIAQADLRVATRDGAQNSARPIRKAGRLDDMNIKDAELAAVLQQTWSELASLENNDDLQDDTFEHASSLLRLTKISDNEVEKTIATIFPSSSVLTLSVPPDSPLTLFLGVADIKIYSSITSYLLSIRRAQLHLSSLWKLTPLRRWHPTPLGPPLSSTKAGAVSLATRRARDDARTKQMRKHWATARKALFVLSETGAYFQGEVIGRHWSSLREWIDEVSGLRPASKGSRPSSAQASQLKTSQASLRSGLSRDEAAKAETAWRQSSDPANLSQAHSACLAAIWKGLLLDDERFVNSLRELLTILDHFIALYSRLQSVWQGLDLQEDEGVVDALINYKKDEGDVWWEMERSGKLVEERVMALVECVRHRERGDGRSKEEEIVNNFDEMSVGAEASGYVPWRGRTVERLIMKLDFLAGGRVDGDKKAVRLDYDDDY